MVSETEIRELKTCLTDKGYTVSQKRIDDCAGTYIQLLIKW